MISIIARSPLAILAVGAVIMLTRGNSDLFWGLAAILVLPRILPL